MDSEEFVELIGGIAGYLQHERPGWVRVRTGDRNLARRQVDDKQNVVDNQTPQRPYHNRKEIGGGHHVPMRFQERTA